MKALKLGRILYFICMVIIEYNRENFVSCILWFLKLVIYLILNYGNIQNPTIHLVLVSLSILKYNRQCLLNLRICFIKGSTSS